MAIEYTPQDSSPPVTAIDYEPQNTSGLVSDPAEGGSFSASNEAELAGAQSFAAKAKEAQNAAEQSETNAATSASNAATSESNAATSESNAATSESNAATSESNAATSESNAATSESNAATSESNAATSASNASTSEANALASATAAQNLEVTSASFDTADGTLTLTKANSGTLTTDFDGRYAELTGATFTGDVDIEGTLQLRDADRIIMGDTIQDLYFSHRSDLGFGLVSEGTELRLRAPTVKLMSNVDVFLLGEDDTNGNPKVSLNYNNSEKLVTTSGGIDVTGNIAVSGDATVGGELTVNGSAEAELFKGDIEGAVHFKGAVESGATLTKGDVVYISGYLGQKTEVDLADASDSSKMPAFGIVAADPVGVNVDIVTFGTLKSINTSTYTDGDELYVSTTAGQLTATAPSGEGNLVQNIAKVVKAHNSGNIKVMGAGRTNATPNLNDGNIFIGDSNNLATTASFASQVASAETSHADVLVDGDFTSNGLMKRDGVGVYSVDSSTYATETYVDTAVSNLVDSAPATLDTLNELASALGDDANFSTTVTTSIGTKWTEDSAKIDNWDTAYSWGDHGTEGYLTSEANNLITSVTWANVPDANITESSVTQHQAALSITESQISDLGTYLTASDITGKANLSGATFTGNVNIGLPPSGTQSLTVAGAANLYGGASVTGDITVTGTVDGVDVSALATTANSAMQDLVDDTSPQLGGNLDLNGNDITGTGNVSITQASTTVPALTLTSTDDGTVESPTMRLVRNSASQEDADQIGQIEFYGKVGSGSAIREYAGIKAVLNDVSPTSYDGQLDFYTRKNSAETKLMSLTPTALELTNGTDLDVAGNITVDGTVNQNQTTTFGGSISFTNNTHLMTVDGRDLSVDGAKIDEAKKIPFSQVVSQQMFGSSPSTILDLQIPQTTVPSKQAIDFSLAVRRYNATNTLKKSSTYNILVQVMSTSNSGVSLGTATYSSTPSTYNAWYYVSGDKTHLMSNKRGKFATSSTGSNSTNLQGLYYDDVNDRTYFRISKYPDAASVFNNVEVFYSLSAFTSAGTYVTQTGNKTRYNSLEPQASTSQSISMQEILPETTSRTYVRIQFDAVSSTTSISTYVEDLSGHVENLL